MYILDISQEKNRQSVITSPWMCQRKERKKGKKKEEKRKAKFMSREKFYFLIF